MNTTHHNTLTSKPISQVKQQVDLCVSQVIGQHHPLVNLYLVFRVKKMLFFTTYRYLINISPPQHVYCTFSWVAKQTRTKHVLIRCVTRSQLFASLIIFKKHTILTLPLKVVAIHCVQKSNPNTHYTHTSCEIWIFLSFTSFLTLLVCCADLSFKLDYYVLKGGT